MNFLKLAILKKIWFSQVLSQITINLINFIIVLRIFEATHSTVAVYLVWIFYAIPSLLLGPFSGTIVDFVEKRKILVTTTFLEAAIMLLYLPVKEKLWPIYSVILMYSMVNQLYTPAEASTLTTVVPKKLLPVANTIFMFTIYISMLIGCGLAGSLVRVVGGNTPFIIAAVLLALASLSASLLPKGMKGEREKIDGFPAFWCKVTDGYSFIKKNTQVLYPLILLVWANIILNVFSIIAPVFATEILKIELLDVGWVLIIPIGFGALFGVGLIVSFLKQLRKKLIITIGLTLLSFCLFLSGLVLPHLTLGKIFVTVFTTFLMGVGLVCIFIPSQTFLQENTPAEFRGRVFGVLGFMFTLASVLPILLTATIADIFGVTLVVLALALIMTIAAVYSLREPYVIQPAKA